jgi:DNA-binding MarR family transcriptional regulator
MENQKLMDLNFDIWILIADLHHKMVMVRRNELIKYKISTRQLHVIRLIDTLGEKARLSEIANKVQRKPDVIARQAMSMEKDGLIRRIKDTPKSRLLRLELTDAGREMLKINHYSQGMNDALSMLSVKERHELHSVLSRMSTKLKEYT